MMPSTTAERWGGFVLSPDAATETRTTDVPPRRPGIAWQEGEGLWDNSFAHLIEDEQSARADPKIPWPASLPDGETFLAANILADSQGSLGGMVAFLRRNHPDLQAYARRDGRTTGDDASLFISWSLRFGQPAYFTNHAGLAPVNGTSLPDATVVEDELQKVTINGDKGILRTWRPQNGQVMYQSRFPTVTINWFHGDVAWTLQSTFLAPEEALRVAESVRETDTN
jgi:hypothetical protein